MEQHSIQEWEVGEHRLRWEPPNLLKITWKGVVLEEHADLVNARFAAIKVPRYWLLSDISGSEVPAPHVRKKLSETQASLQIVGVAVIVSTAYQRVVMHMLVRAVNLLTKAQMKTAFFDDEKSARNWLAAEMQRTADSR